MIMNIHAMFLLRKAEFSYEEAFDGCKWSFFEPSEGKIIFQKIFENGQEFKYTHEDVLEFRANTAAIVNYLSTVWTENQRVVDITK